MQTIRIIAMGKLKEDYLVKGCNEYIKRLKPFCKLEIVELEPVKTEDNPNEAQIKKALFEESKMIMQKVHNGVIIAMCIEGVFLSSDELSRKIESFATEGDSQLCFVIGSSHGLDNLIKEKAKLCLSMSKMTFPHQLARLMLLEQIYRAQQISNGGKYHK